jgi:hypothetical protein
MFSEYRTANESKAKKFTDCAIIYPDCAIPKRSVWIKKRKNSHIKQNEPITENPEDAQTKVPDVVAKYVKNL